MANDEKQVDTAQATDYSQYSSFDIPENTVTHTVFNKTQVMVKLIEPENDIQKNEFNRNLQMGNIDKISVAILEEKYRVKKLVQFVPDEHGAFIFTPIGEILNSEINFATVITNSVDGFGRKAGATQIRKEEFKDTTPRGAFDFFGRNKEKQ